MFKHGCCSGVPLPRPAWLQDETDESPGDDSDWVAEDVVLVERSDSGSDASDAGAAIFPGPAASPKPKAGPKAAPKAAAAPAAGAVPEAAPKASPKAAAAGPKVILREQTEDRHTRQKYRHNMYIS